MKNKTMKNLTRNHFGFSLIETMLAAGILGVGLVLIAMVFPVGIKLTSVATERTVGAIAADEAFAKIKLWGFPRTWPTLTNQTCADYRELLNTQYAGYPGWSIKDISWSEFLYPSDDNIGQPRVYHWSALCRALDDKQVQITVFVTRKVAENIQFRSTINSGVGPLPGSLQAWPSPVVVSLKYDGTPRELKIGVLLWGDEHEFLNGGMVLLEDRTGRLYTIEQVRDSDGDGQRETLVLSQPWQWPGYELNPDAPPAAAQTNLRFWVVPPGIGSSRNPVIAVRQKVMRID